MLLGLTSRFICNISSYLYPAYASYKALNRTPANSQEAIIDIERWLMFWTVVGSWAGIEGLGWWFLSCIPFYSFFKCIFFLWLSLPQTQGSTYIFNAILGPFFDAHEYDIDAFLNDLKGRAAGGLVRFGEWVWIKLRESVFLQVASSQGSTSYPQYPQSSTHSFIPNSLQGFIGDGHNPTSSQSHSGMPVTTPQPPTLQDPASGVMMQVYGVATHFAARYLPAAVSVIANASAQATQSLQNTAQQSQRSHSRSGGQGTLPQEFSMKEFAIGGVSSSDSPPGSAGLPPSYAGGRSSSQTMRFAQGLGQGQGQGSALSFASGVQVSPDTKGSRKRASVQSHRSISGSNSNSHSGSGSDQDIPLAPSQSGGSNEHLSRTGSGTAPWGTVSATGSGSGSGFDEITQDEVLESKAAAVGMSNVAGGARPGAGRRTSSWFGWNAGGDKPKTE